MRGIDGKVTNTKWCNILKEMWSLRWCHIDVFETWFNDDRRTGNLIPCDRIPSHGSMLPHLPMPINTYGLFSARSCALILLTSRAVSLLFDRSNRSASTWQYHKYPEWLHLPRTCSLWQMRFSRLNCSTSSSSNSRLITKRANLQHCKFFLAYRPVCSYWRQTLSRREFPYPCSHIKKQIQTSGKGIFLCFSTGANVTTRFSLHEKRRRTPNHLPVSKWNRQSIMYYLLLLCSNHSAWS